MYGLSTRRRVIIGLLSVSLSGLLSSCTRREAEKREPTQAPAITSTSVASDEQNNVEVYRVVSPGVVNITSRSYTQGHFGVYPSEGSGSGSILDEQGHILTNYHVVRGAAQLEVQIEDDQYPARLIGTDRDNDLAVIKVEAPRDRLTIVKLGTSQGLQVGQKVLAIGNPFGLQRTLTTGVISGLERPLRDPASRRTIEGAIQTDASINPGNSGGPLLNAGGEMIGINTAIYSPSSGSVGIGFAVPVDTAKKIIPDLIARGHVSRPWLGISALPLDSRLARTLGLPVEEGIIIGEVYAGSGAAAAGLRATVARESSYGGIAIERLGDVILSVNGQQVKNTNDLQNLLKDKQVGQTVQVEVLREGSRVTVPVRLSERPAEER